MTTGENCIIYGQKMGRKEYQFKLKQISNKINENWVWEDASELVNEWALNSWYWYEILHWRVITLTSLKISSTQSIQRKV